MATAPWRRCSARTMLELQTALTWLAARTRLAPHVERRGVKSHGAAGARSGNARRTWRRTRPNGAAPPAKNRLVAVSSDIALPRDIVLMDRAPTHAQCFGKVTPPVERLIRGGGLSSLPQPKSLPTRMRLVRTGRPRRFVFFSAAFLPGRARVVEFFRLLALKLCLFSSDSSGLYNCVITSRLG